MTSTIIAPAQPSLERNHRTFFVVRVACWLTALVLGALQAWTARFAMNPDGISYLDIGDAYWRHDWHNAINAYWSPLYSWILGGFLNVLKPSLYWEYPIAHLANFSIYVLALACFEFLLIELHLVDSWMRTVGSSLFILCALVLVGLQPVTPDMLVMAFTFLVAAISLKLTRSANHKAAAIYGIVVGLSYYAKTVMLPIGLTFIIVVLLVTRRKQVITSIVLAICIAGPWIMVCSMKKNRLTIGESARWNYLVFVNHVQPFFPKGPQLKLLADHPATYDLSAISGTYPPWTDPSYWQNGINPSVDIAGTANRVQQSLLQYFVLVIDPRLLLNLLIAFFLAALAGLEFAGRREWLVIALPSLSGILAYSLLLVENRYVAPFVLILWLLLFAGLHLNRKLAVFLILSNIVITAWDFEVVRAVNHASDFAVPAATAMHSYVHEGDKIAVVSPEGWMTTAGHASFIARLVRTPIVAESTDVDEFISNADRFIETFRGAGIHGVLLYSPHRNPASSWHRLANTDYYYRPIG